MIDWLIAIFFVYEFVLIALLFGFAIAICIFFFVLALLCNFIRILKRYK